MRFGDGIAQGLVENRVCHRERRVDIIMNDLDCRQKVGPATLT